MNYRRLVIVGGTGFVGRNLAKHLKPHFKDVVCLGRDATPEPFKSDDLVINAAGNKNVPGCEKAPTMAYEANTLFAGKVAMFCRFAKAKLVHISSDHAYAQPRTVYGDSKRLGEELVRRENPDALIVVTGHVYDVDCPWVRWLDGELRAGNQIEAWLDISNQPTYCRDLAENIMTMISCGFHEHVCLGPPSNRFELFREYARANHLDANLITAVSSKAPWYYPRSFNLPSRVYMPMRNLREGFTSMRVEMENAK